MIKFNKSNDNLINEDKVINSLQYQISFIKSRKLTDKDFIDFLVSLIEYVPKDRPSFEQIYTNKWLNKDVEYIDNIIVLIAVSKNNPLFNLFDIFNTLSHIFLYCWFVIFFVLVLISSKLFTDIPKLFFSI